jgi:hypothetical protein
MRDLWQLARTTSDGDFLKTWAVTIELESSVTEVNKISIGNKNRN